jgi:hypothetical protein
MGNTIQKIHLTLNLSPVVISYVSKYEDQTGSIGIRLKADHISLNLVYVQRTSKKISTVIIENQKPQSVSKWNIESMQLLCSSIDSRVMTMIHKVNNIDSASAPGKPELKIPPHDINQWVFIEDLHYVENYKDLTMSPFFSSPKLGYYYFADSNGISQKLSKCREGTFIVNNRFS